MKEKIFKEAFALFVNGTIPEGIFQAYLNDIDGEGASRLQWWIVDNMKTEISDWCTGIGIIEAVEHLYNVAKENGNIK
jgi:hypothetical protein